MVAVDTGTAILALGLNLVLISRYGALGAALATTGILLIQNLLVHLGLRRILDGLPFPSTHRKAYLWVTGGAGLLLGVQSLLNPPLIVSVVIGVATSLVVLMRNRDVLMIGDTFPELAKIPFLGKVLGAPS